MNENTPFWQRKTMEEMNPEEWESLCDGCGRCCLLKLEDEDSHELYYTNVVCKYHDQNKCQCSVYPQRNALVPDCVHVTPEVAREPWLPDTCAYRLLAEGKPLPAWHPLVSGTQQTVWDAQICIVGMAISEEYVHPDELVEHLIDWQE